VDRFSRKAGTNTGITHYSGRFGNASGSRRMWRQHDRVSRLDRDYDLEDRCRRGVGRRNDRGYDTTGRSYFDNAVFVGNNANCLKTSEIIPDVFSGKSILFPFIFGVSETRFFVGKQAKPGGFGESGP
jgi:hypothetical protein